MSNNRDPNTPDDLNVENISNINQQQVDIANALNQTLSQIESRFDSIRQSTQNQTDAMIQISSNMSQMNTFANQTLMNTTRSIAMIVDSANQVVNSYNANYQQQLNNSISSVATSAAEGFTQGARALNELGESTKEISQASTNLTQDVAKQTSQMSDVYKDQGSNIREYNESTTKAVEATEDFKNEMEALSDSITSLTGGIAGKVTSVLKAGAGIFKIVVSGASTVISSAAKFIKFSLTLPFTVAKAASAIGNKLREDTVQVIQQASEDLKEKFDMHSTIGEGIMSLTNRGKGMLLAFQSPSSKLVKLFGLGASGIANMIKEFGQHLESMGHFSEMFGRSFKGNQKRLEDFLVLVKGLGLSSEDLAYLALDAGTNLKHINVRLSEMNVTIKTVSDAFGVDRKRLSKNFMILRKDITQFGHLSDEEIAKTTARLTQMKVKLEDAAAIFKKFSTFEDAANSVAILSQTFGMNLDAFDMIQAQNPEEIINMFRNSMLETGRSFQDLNRFEKDLMAQHTGMSAESLAAMMNYRDLGLTHEEAIRKMESEKPHAKQMKALKSLNSAIKEIQKVMSFTSPFEAFADGLAANSTLSGDLKNAMISLSKGYEGIFEFARKMRPDTWEGIARPIRIIIDIMKDIFNSKAFRNGLVTAIETVALFVSNMFGVSNADRITSEIQRSVSLATKKGGALDPKLNPKFAESFTQAITRVDPKLLAPFKSYVDLGGIEDIKSPKEASALLDKLKQAAKDKGLTKEYRTLMNQINRRLQGIKYTDSGTGEQKAIVKTFHEELGTNMLEAVKLNSENTSKLVDLSRNVMGAVIEGASVAFIAGLRLINDGIDKVKPALDKKGKKQNMIESFLKFKPGEFRKIGTLIGNELDRFLENSEAIGGLTSFFVNGFKDIFKTVIDVFLDVLAVGIDEIFGFEFSKTPESTLRRAKVASASGSSPSATETVKNLQTSLSNEDTPKMDDIAAILISLDRKIAKISDPTQKEKQKTIRAGLEKSFLKSEGDAGTLSQIGRIALGQFGRIKLDKTGKTAIFEGDLGVDPNNPIERSFHYSSGSMKTGRSGKGYTSDDTANFKSIMNAWNASITRKSYEPFPMEWTVGFRKITEADLKDAEFNTILRNINQLKGNLPIHRALRKPFGVYTNKAFREHVLLGGAPNLYKYHDTFRTSSGHSFLNYLSTNKNALEEVPDTVKRREQSFTDEDGYEQTLPGVEFASRMTPKNITNTAKSMPQSPLDLTSKLFEEFNTRNKDKPASARYRSQYRYEGRPEYLDDKERKDQVGLTNALMHNINYMLNKNRGRLKKQLTQIYGKNADFHKIIFYRFMQRVRDKGLKPVDRHLRSVSDNEGLAVLIYNNLNEQFQNRQDVSIDAKMDARIESFNSSYRRNKKEKVTKEHVQQVANMVSEFAQSVVTPQQAEGTVVINNEFVDKLIPGLIKRNLIQIATFPFEGVQTLTQDAIKSATLNSGHGSTSPTTTTQQ